MTAGGDKIARRSLVRGDGRPIDLGNICVRALKQELIAKYGERSWFPEGHKFTLSRYKTGIAKRLSQAGWHKVFKETGPKRFLELLGLKLTSICWPKEIKRAYREHRDVIRTRSYSINMMVEWTMPSIDFLDPKNMEILPSGPPDVDTSDVGSSRQC